MASVEEMRMRMKRKVDDIRAGIEKKRGELKAAVKELQKDKVRYIQEFRGGPKAAKKEAE